MKRLIKDQEWIDYINETMTSTQKRDFVRKILANGESKLLGEVIIANYKSQEAYANELLGEDDSYKCDDDLPLDLPIAASFSED